MMIFLLLAGNFFNSVIEVFLDLRQFFKLLKAKETKNTALVIKDSNEFSRMKEYNLLKLKLSILKIIADFIQFSVVLKYNLLVILYESCSKWINHVYYSQIIFMIVYSFLQSLFSTPFDIFKTFYIEEKFGFNKTTVEVYIIDFIKSTTILSLLAVPLLYSVLKIIDMFPVSFYLQLFLFICMFQIILLVLFPVVIQPLFNKFTPLEEGKLKDEINKLANQINFKSSSILIMDGSSRSHHSNAYFIGLFKEKRIVLYDTLMKQANDDEILAILCHEFGHWSYNHIWKNILFSFVNVFSYSYLFNYFMKNTEIFKNLPVIIKIIYFIMLLSFLSPLLTLLQNAMNRNYEKQADIYAVKMGMGENLKEGLIKLHQKNMNNICIDNWYSTYHHTHPTLFERLELIDNAMKKKVD